MTEKNARIWFFPIALCILLSMILLCSCKNIAELTFDNKGSFIELKKGDKINIKLESNPTTGYAWVLSENTDETIISMTNSEFIQTEKEEKLVGSGGYEIFTFQAKKNGQTEIILTYKRSWEEKELKEESLFKINITVE